MCVYMYTHTHTHTHTYILGSLVAQMVKHLPAVQEIRVLSLGWEDPLEKKMATHSSTLVWKISWTEEPGRLQSTGSQRVRHDFTFTFIYIYIYYIYTHTSSCLF